MTTLKTLTALTILLTLTACDSSQRARLDAERAEKRVTHWRSVIASACEQSGRARLPHLAEPRRLDAFAAEATGLTLDLTGKGLGLRSTRYSMLVKDGKVATLNVEGPGKFEVSDGATMPGQVK